MGNQQTQQSRSNAPLNQSKKSKKKSNTSKKTKSKLKNKFERNKRVLFIDDTTTSSHFLCQNETKSISSQLSTRVANIVLGIIHEDNTGNNTLELCHHLSSLPSLHTLDLSSNIGLNDNHAFQLLELLPTLSTIIRLNLSYCPNVGGSNQFNQLYRSLLLPTSCSLTSLILRDVQLTDTDFSVLITSITRLHTLDVSENQLTDASMQQLSIRLLETSTIAASTNNNTTNNNSNTNPAAEETKTKKTEDNKNSNNSNNKKNNNINVIYPGLGLYRLHLGQNNTRIQTMVDLTLIIPKLHNLKLFDNGHGITTTSTSGGRTKRCLTIVDVTSLLIRASLNRNLNNENTCDAILQRLLSNVPFEDIIQAIKILSAHDVEKEERMTSTSNSSKQNGLNRQPSIYKMHDSNSNISIKEAETPLFWALHHKLWLLVNEMLNHDEYSKITTLKIKRGSGIKTNQGKLFLGTVTFQLNSMLLDVKRMKEFIVQKKIKIKMNI